MHQFPDIEQQLLKILSTETFKEETAIANKLEVPVRVIGFVLKNMKKQNKVCDRYYFEFENKILWHEWQLNSNQ